LIPRPARRLDILIVENDPATVRLTKEAFKEAGLMDGVRSVAHGADALACLRRQEQYADQPRPDIIFLDLHLPRESGLDILKAIKSDPELTSTPVVVVSGSENPREVREAYQLHASCYVRKPSDLDQFLYFIRTCYEFWGKIVTLPPKN
jgi:chemotaxis family two-component system response regulator Rcp1